MSAIVPALAGVVIGCCVYRYVIYAAAKRSSFVRLILATMLCLMSDELFLSGSGPSSFVTETISKSLTCLTYISCTDAVLGILSYVLDFP